MNTLKILLLQLIACLIITSISFGQDILTLYNGGRINIKSGTDGLVHISELADYRVKKVTDVVKEGEVIKVKVLDITRDGKIKLSYKAAKKDAEKE